LFSVMTICDPVKSVALVSELPAARLMLVVAAGAVNAGLGAVALGHVGHWTPSVRLIGGTADTLALNAVGVPPLLTSVTPLGKNVETPMFIALSSGTGRFHVMSQFGDSVGNAQADASIASAIIPTSGRRMFAGFGWAGIAAKDRSRPRRELALHHTAVTMLRSTPRIT
jgi:hypothetical protein